MLTLVHERLDAAMPRVAENIGPGWTRLSASWRLRHKPMVIMER